MNSPTKIRWGLGVAVLAGVCFTATGAAFMWGHTGSDADLVHSYLLGVAGYIGTILAVFTGLLALPLGRLSREFPARMFWRTLLRPLPLVCLTGLIAEGAICFSATLGPRSGPRINRIRVASLGQLNLMGIPTTPHPAFV